MITSSAGFILATPTKCATTSLEGVAKRHMKNAGADGDLFRIMDWDHPRRQHRMCLPPRVRDAAGGIVVDGRSGEDDEHSEWMDHDRWLLTRNPFDRYVSIYKYLSSPQNYSQWGAKEIQGSNWGGSTDVFLAARDRGEEWPDRPKMNFREFLIWYCDQRDMLRSPEGVEQRGPLDQGRAYRSPWVWTDSLVESAALLEGQDGDGELVGFLSLEHLWDGPDVVGSLRRMLACYDLTDEDINLGELHANRSTGWSGADVTFSRSFWGGFGLSRGNVNRADFRVLSSASRNLLRRVGVVDEFKWWVTALSA